MNEDSKFLVSSDMLFLDLPVFELFVDVNEFRVTHSDWLLVSVRQIFSFKAGSRYAPGVSKNLDVLFENLSNNGGFLSDMLNVLELLVASFSDVSVKDFVVPVGYHGWLSVLDDFPEVLYLFAIDPVAFNEALVGTGSSTFWRRLPDPIPTDMPVFHFSDVSSLASVDAKMARPNGLGDKMFTFAHAEEHYWLHCALEVAAPFSSDAASAHTQCPLVLPSYISSNLGFMSPSGDFAADASVRLKVASNDLSMFQNEFRFAAAALIGQVSSKELHDVTFTVLNVPFDSQVL